MDCFWSSFWPNLVSTLLGVIVGVPIALWINRKAATAAERSQHRHEQERLQSGIATVLRALEFNRDRLQDLAATLARNQAPFDPRLDLGAWEAVREEIVPFLKRPDLQRRLAYCFARLGSLDRLVSLYLDLVAGVASALGSAGQTRTALHSYLTQSIQELTTEIAALVGELEGISGGG